jgi:hypothetical protein
LFIVPITAWVGVLRNMQVISDTMSAIEERQSDVVTELALHASSSSSSSSSASGQPYDASPHSETFADIRSVTQLTLPQLASMDRIEYSIEHRSAEGLETDGPSVHAGIVTEKLSIRSEDGSTLSDLSFSLPAGKISLILSIETSTSQPGGDGARGEEDSAYVTNDDANVVLSAVAHAGCPPPTDSSSSASIPFSQRSRIVSGDVSLQGRGSLQWSPRALRQRIAYAGNDDIYSR